MRFFYIIIFGMLFFLPLNSDAYGQKSPFGVPAGSQTGASAQPKASAITTRSQSPSLLQRAWVKVLTIQRDLHRQLAAAVRHLKRDGGASAAWLLASLSFIYGVVHAVGPGHGKAVISAYVLANERTVRRGVILSFLASAVQGLSAIILVGILAIALKATGMKIKAFAAYFETASYALITLVGLWLLVSQLRGWLAQKRADAHNHSHAHDHDACCGHAHMPDPQDLEGKLSLRKAAAIIFAVGIRPCTGAIIVLVFALANGVFMAGVAATFAMALGTAITVSLLAALAVGSKQLALRFAGENGKWIGAITNLAGFGGALLVLALGVTLFIGSLGPARPF